jgi:hypothetical protein
VGAPTYYEVFMRNFLRKWLGITDQPTRFELNEEIRDYMNSEIFFNNLVRKLEFKKEYDIRKEAASAVSEELSKIVEPEQFIDDVVERIRKKQV